MQGLENYNEVIATLREIEQRVLWLAVRMVDEANRRDAGGIKVGDDRYEVEKVSSHDGLNWDAVTVHDAAQLLSLVEEETDVIAIDEVQFFDWTIADVCQQLADGGKRVILAGLDMDFRGEPFGPMPLLMAQAESVDKLQAICVVCGAPASRTQRLIDGEPARYDEPVVVVGAAELYEARCRRHHDVPKG